MASLSTSFDLVETLKEEINLALSTLFPEEDESYYPIFKVAKYSLQAPGKRIRPLLALLCIDACEKEWKMGLPIVLGIEMIHTYSLIHDDLPCMDNDDLRRGLPTCHKKFGIAPALLAGDLLLTYAFEFIARQPLDSGIKLELIKTLSEAAGGHGMIGGQYLDIQNTPNLLEIELIKIHTMKTAALIGASCEWGAILAGREEREKAILRNFGRFLGLAYQIVDDLIDQEDSEITGKSSQSDVKQHKSTFHHAPRKKNAKKQAAYYHKLALGLLNEFPGKKEHLIYLSYFLIDRLK